MSRARGVCADASSAGIACILFPHVRAQIELARRPELAERPIVIVERPGERANGRGRVVDVLPALVPISWGMTVEQVLSQVPEAVVVEADEPGYWREFEQVLAALEEVSDRVEGAELGVVYVGLEGLAVMYGGEAPMLDALLQAVPSQFGPRIGVAPSQPGQPGGKFAAFVAARTRESSGVSRVGADAAGFLAPLPIRLLPAELAAPDLLDDLERLGLRRLGDIAAQDGSALLDRFGREGRRIWELARGIDPRPLRPRLDAESVSETLALPSAAVSLEVLRVAVETLLARLCGHARLQGRRAGAAVMACTLEDAPDWQRIWERAVHFKGGIGSGAESRRRAVEIIMQRLERDHPPGPVESMTITLSEISGASGLQLSLFPDARVEREQRLLTVERELSARLGGRPALHRVVEAAAWHPAPELRMLQVPIDPAAADRLRPLAEPSAIEVREGPGQEPAAIRVNDQWQAVARIEDRWSFDLWWRPTPMSRQYYQITQRNGQSQVLYRDEHQSSWYQQTA